MNMAKAVSLGFLLCSISSAASYILAQGARSSEPEGTIVLSEKHDGSGANCSIAFRSGTYEMSSPALDCKRNKMNFFRLIGVPSAARILFTYDNECYTSGDWFFLVRTYIESVTTKIISIPDEVALAKPGQIISKGVLMVNGAKANPDVANQLGCIRIEKSDLVKP
ncbi:hypothetical protein [Pseudomonas sp. COR18]|uniref:hypothetical protein n=1 Tax=Pseudomonas sp. COR18 TaxID=3399680 RepID=UPI003B005B11